MRKWRRTKGAITDGLVTIKVADWAADGLVLAMNVLIDEVEQMDAGADDRTELPGTLLEGSERGLLPDTRWQLPRRHDWWPRIDASKG